MKSAVFAGGALLFAAVTYRFAKARTSDLTTVALVNIERYLGKWYEIARYPNRFQRHCVGASTATYTLLPDGKIAVLNVCRDTHGRLEEAKGTAQVADSKTNAKLKVTFTWPFSGDYWIIGLDADYRWAVVGEPRRKYIWILAREPRMSDIDYREALKVVHERKYDASRLQMTLQHEAS